MEFREQWEENVVEKVWVCLARLFLGRTIVPWTVGAVFAVIFFHPKHIPAQGLNVCPSIPFSHSCRKENTIFLPLAVVIKDSLGDFLLPFASLPCVFPLAAICSSAVMLKALPGELRLYLPFRASTHLEIIMETLLLYTSPTKIQAVLGGNQDSVLWIYLILSCGEQRGIFYWPEESNLALFFTNKLKYLAVLSLLAVQGNSGLP